MRPRLTVAFGLLALLVVGAFVAFRTVTITDLAAAELRAQLDREAFVVATVVAGRPRPPTEADLAPYAMPDRSVTVSPADGPTLRVAGAGWDGTSAEKAPTGSASVAGVTVTVRAPEREVDREVATALPSLLALGAALVALAVAAGVLVAKRLSQPFVTLAAAADALARGRLDLRLPRTRVAEARAISVALAGGARQLEASLRRERDLALRASHELRTPLTALRLELQELREHEDAPDDVVAALDRAEGHVERLDQAVGNVLEETRSHPVVPEARLPLALVAPALAQRWRDTLALAGVGLEVEVTGDSTLALTPGPVEQLLDEVLLEVLAHRAEAVCLVIDGGDRHVRATVTVQGAAEHSPGRTSGPLDRARAVAENVGGRVTGGLTSPGGLVVLVPRR